MRKIECLAVLETMWDYRVSNSKSFKAPRYFEINPLNFSGKRLYYFIGHENLLVTNACPSVVNNASQHAVPDVEWLDKNVNGIEANLILVCGVVARNTFLQIKRPDTRIIIMPHPAARNWTKGAMELMRDKIQNSQDSLFVTFSKFEPRIKFEQIKDSK
jgi:hypothetical protein